MIAQSFLNRFCFDPSLRLHLGAEVEYLIVDASGKPVPVAAELLRQLDEAYTYELSACQIEHRTNPLRTPDMIVSACGQGLVIARDKARELGYNIQTCAVAPFSMSLDVYPDERYLCEVVPFLSVERLRAACRVMGTHIHIGLGSLSEALLVYNALVEQIDYLLSLCPSENEARLDLYSVVQPNNRPPLYSSAQSFYDTAVACGFAENPRNCWHLVRISRHGTVEVRLFPATEDAALLVLWASAIQDIARATVG